MQGVEMTYDNKKLFDANITELTAESLLKNVEELAVGACATDAFGKIVWVDKKYASFLGLKVEDLVGRFIADMVPNSRVQDVLSTGKPIPFDFMKYQRGWAIVSRFPILDADGAVCGVFGFVLFDSPGKLAGMLSRFRAMGVLPEAENVPSIARSTRYKIRDFIGESPQALQVRNLASRYASATGSILITGQSGTGKEVVAQGIHDASLRSDRPFVAVHVGAIPDTLVEAELFGAVAGAYTGVDKKGRIGKIQLADKGTLFLDEVGDIPLSVQAKLLRFLEERSIEALGSNRVSNVDVRVIAATSLDLRKLIFEGKFRPDLYYRLNVLPLRIPSLEERIEDLPILAKTIINTTVFVDAETTKVELAESALALLKRHNWPGNVRELRNVLERCAVLAENGIIKGSDIAEALESEDVDLDLTRDSHSLAQVVEQAERMQITRELRRARFNLTYAAKSLGISRTTLYKKASAFGLLTNETCEDDDE
jgi:transcriptional regulator with PAS, ATPase and Fis domain